MRTEPTSYRKKGEFVARSIAGETILVPIRGQVGDLEAIYRLNDVAACIWNEIDGRQSINDIAESLCREFEVSVDKAREDVRVLLSDLEKAGIVQRAA